MKIDFEFVFYGLIILLITIGILIPIVLYFAIPFDTVITVKDKYTESRGRRGSIAYHIVDTDNHIYKVENVWFKGDFNRAEDYNMMDKGGRYRVQGYGKRVDWLGWYPIIHTVTKA